MNSEKHIASARIFCIVLFIITYLVWDFAISYNKRMAVVHKARQEYFKLFLLEEIGVDKLRQLKGSKGAILLENHFVGGIGELTTKLSKIGDDLFLILQVKNINRNKWLIKLPLKEGLRADNSKASEELGNIAFNLGLDYTGEDSYKLVFRDIERNLLDQGVLIPSVGFELKSNYALWVIAILAMFILIIIRNRINSAFLDDKIGLDEPWIALEGFSGLERWTATVWLIGVLSCPWIVNFMLTLTITTQISVNGSISIAYNIFKFVVILILMFISGRTSLSIVSLILHLRNIRREQISIILEKRT